MTAIESTDGKRNLTGWIIMVALIAVAAVVIALVDWRSDAQRLADQIDALDYQLVGTADTYNHLLPADLAERTPGFDYMADHSPQIAGEETTMVSYYISSGLSVASFAYEEHVWGYLLSTDQTSIAIVDTDRDGGFDRLYRANQPVYIPDWVLEIAAGR